MEEKSEEKDIKNQNNFGSEISTFIKHIEAQADIVPLVMGLISTKLVQESRQVEKYIKTNGIVESENGDENSSKLLIPNDKFKGFLDLNDTVETTSIAYRLLPVNFIVSFVSQYDAYLGSLIKTMFNVKPELLNSTEKSILLTELIGFASINEAKEFIIEKEVESVLRESHLKQFKWLENKLNIPLRKDLPSFSEFIEITERRNLFVHSNGVISRQYIENCHKQKVKGIDQAQLGEKLNVDPAYYQKCYSILFEIGVKLGQVIWRKVQPTEIEKADAHLNNVCYDLLVKGHSKLALNLLTFATDTLKKHHDHEMLCIFNINKALAYYLSNKKKEATKLLSKQDWSATSEKFKLAIAVLNEEFDDAIEIMKSIGSSNKHIDKNAYREWPLFKTFRKRGDFKTAYKEIFGEELIYIENKPKNLEDLLSELKRIKSESKKGETAANNV